MFRIQLKDGSNDSQPTVNCLLQRNSDASWYCCI